MDKHILILLLAAFVTVVRSHPFSVIFKTGITSNATAKAEGKAGVESGWDGGPTLEGKAHGKVFLGWLKNAYGVIGYLDSDGQPHGIKMSIGSVMDGKGVGEASAKAGTNIINTKLDKNAIADAEGSYKAGFDIHFLDKNEILEVEGVNKRPVKTPEQTDPNSNPTLEDLDQVNRDSKEMKEDAKQDGYLKKVWNNYIGK